MRKLAASLTVAAFATGMMVASGGSALAHTNDGHRHHHSWHYDYQRDDHRTYDDHRSCDSNSERPLVNVAVLNCSSVL